MTHHEPRKGGEYSLATSAIHIADAWVNTNRVGSSGCGFELAIHPEALARIGIELEEIEQIGSRAAQQIQGSGTTIHEPLAGDGHSPVPALPTREKR